MLINNLLRKIRRNLDDHGFLSTLKKSILYSISPLFEARIYRIYTINLESLTGLQSKRLDFQFEFIGPGDTEIIQQIEFIEEWLHGKVQQMLERHGICLVALHNEKVAGFNLVSFDKTYIPLLRLKKVLAEDEAWSEQITVQKEYRQSELASNLRLRIFEKLKKIGKNKLSGGALINNAASLKLARRTGFREVTDIHFLKFFGYKRWRYSEVKK